MRTKDAGMLIYIPTVGRVEKQITIRNMPPRWLAKTFLVAQNGEQHAHQFIECPVTGHLGRVRQWVIEHAATNYPFLLDDDMRFCCYTEDGRVPHIYHDDIGTALDLMEQWLVQDGLAQVGLGPRSQLNRLAERYGAYKEVSRVFGNFGFNRALYLREKFRFDRLEAMTDFDITLQILERGHKNRVSYRWGVGQDAAGSPGGCATYRTAEVQRRAALQLQALHPHAVSLITSKKKSWETLSEHVDVRISWEVAYDSRRGGTGYRQGTLLPTS